jgi:ATP-dependent Zn protease
MSPAAVDKVNELVQETMDKVYKDTKKILEENKAKLDVIANLLMERGIISIEEIEEAFRKIK